MFDVSFGELLLILIVGLLVFGPEKMPHAVRTASQWMARARRSFNQVRADIEREVGVDELKRDFHNQSILESLRDVKKDLTDAQRELDQLPYDLDKSVRNNLLVEREQTELLIEREQAEFDAARTAMPHDDFKHSATDKSALDLERQNRDIENSIHTPTAIPTDAPVVDSPVTNAPTAPATDKTVQR